MFKHYRDIDFDVQEKLSIIRSEYNQLLLVTEQNGYTRKETKEAKEKMIELDIKRWLIYKVDILKQDVDSNELGETKTAGQ